MKPGTCRLARRHDIPETGAAEISTDIVMNDMIQQFDSHLPTQIVFGVDSVHRVGELAPGERHVVVPE